MGFGRGKGFSPAIPDVEPAEPGYGTNDCQPTQDNAGNLCQLWNANSQIFTPDHSYTITGLSLMLAQRLTTRKGPLIVKIEKMATNCWEAEVIWSKALYSTDLPLPDENSITFFPISGIAVEDSTPYRITVHTTRGWFTFLEGEWVEDEAGAAIRWRYKGITNPYPRGDKWFGCNYSAGSGAWSLNEDYDHWFCLHGVADPTIKHIDLEVAASTDDCYTYGATMRIDYEYLFLDYATLDMHAYARFLAVTIPSGATILHAFIELRSYLGINAGSELRIQGIKEVNTATFSTQADADGRAVTDEYLDRPAAAVANDIWFGRWGGNQELKAIIQEIIGQGTWASGNALAIKIFNLSQVGDARVDAWDMAGNATPPRLHIEYRE